MEECDRVVERTSDTESRLTDEQYACRSEHWWPGVQTRRLCWLLGVLALALALRISVFALHDYIGAGDQVLYLRVAKDIRGWTLPPRDVPPGFPALITAAIVLGAPEERAGQIVCLVCGLALVLVLYAIGGSVFGATEGLAIAAIAAFQPELTRRSFDGQSEGPFMLAVFGGIWLAVAGVRGTKSGRRSAALLSAGAALAWAYLMRPEGLAYAALVAAPTWFLLFKRPTARSNAAAGVLCFSVPILVAVGAYSCYVHKNTGQWRVTLKVAAVARHSELETADAEAARWGPEALETRYGGVEALPSRHGLGAWGKRAVHNWSKAYYDVGPQVFDLLLVALAFLGLLHFARHRSEWPLGWLLVFPLLMLPVMSLIILEARLLVPVLPAVVGWAGVGVVACANPATGHLARPHWRPSLILGAALFLVYLKPNFDFIQAYFVGEIPFEEKWAGAWLREHSPLSARIMERKSNVGFYARRRGATTPYAPYEYVIRYARENNVDYLVLSERRVDLRPRLAFLLKTDDYPPELELVYSGEQPAGWHVPARILIFRILPPSLRGDHESSDSRHEPADHLSPLVLTHSAKHPRGHAAHKRPWWHVLGDDGSCCDERALSDGHPSQNGGVCPNEGTTSNCNRRSYWREVSLEGMIPITHVQMRKNEHALRNGYMVGQRDALCQVQQRIVAHVTAIADAQALQARTVKIKQAYSFQNHVAPYAGPGKT